MKTSCPRILFLIAMLCCSVVAHASDYVISTITSYHYSTPDHIASRLNDFNPGIGYLHDLSGSRTGVGVLVYYDSYKNIAETAFGTYKMYDDHRVSIRAIGGILHGYNENEAPMTHHHFTPLVAVDIESGNVMIVVSPTFLAAGYRFAMP